MALLYTLATGLFIVLGALIVLIAKNNHKVVHFSISMAFSVMVMLICLELFPEALEKMEGSFSTPLSWVMLIGFMILGILLLKVLDLFVPDHESDVSEDSVHDNLEHIGIVSSIALILHNIIEGMAIYSTVVTDSSMGLLIVLGVGLHNIPMGMVVTSTLCQSNSGKKHTILYLLGITISTFIGGLIMFFMNNLITDFVLGILLSITLGMLIYIVLFELLGEMFHQRDKKLTVVGIICGIIIFLLTGIFE